MRILWLADLSGRLRILMPTAARSGKMAMNFQICSLAQVLWQAEQAWK
jgi:hypothetical protein